MNIEYGNGKTEYGPGVSINLTGGEVATAIDAWLVANGVNVQGPRTITVNGELCEGGNIYVDPSGFVITPEGQEMSGRGANDQAQCREANLARCRALKLECLCKLIQGHLLLLQANCLICLLRLVNGLDLVFDNLRYTKRGKAGTWQAAKAAVNKAWRDFWQNDKR